LLKYRDRALRENAECAAQADQPAHLRRRRARVKGLRHWPDHLESSAILEQANFHARGGDFGTIDPRLAAFSRQSLMASGPMCRKIRSLSASSREAGIALFARHRCEQPLALDLQDVGH